MADYLIAGSLSIDYFVTADGALHERVLGGGMAYSSVGARLWTPSVGMVGRLIESFPDSLLARCRQEGIGLEHLQHTDSEYVPHIFFAYDDPTIRLDGRPASWYVELGQAIPKELIPLQRPEDFVRGERPDPRVKDLPSDLDGCKAVHLAAINWRNAALIGAKLKEERVPLVTLDPTSKLTASRDPERLTMVLHDVDVFLPSQRQAEEYFRPERPTIEEMAEAFAEMGPAVIVITLGERGQHVFDRRSGQHRRIPAYPSRVADVTGAGHAYSGGFLVGYAETEDPIEAALHGSISASVAIEGSGPFYALDALPGLAEARLQSVREMLGEA